MRCTCTTSDVYPLIYLITHLWIYLKRRIIRMNRDLLNGASQSENPAKLIIKEFLNTPSKSRL